MTSHVIDVASVSEFLKTKYSGVNEQYVHTFTPFILGSQTELCIDVGKHYDMFGYVTKESIKHLVQKVLAKATPTATDKYAILPGPRKSDKIMVDVDGLLKLFEIKNKHGWKLYKEMEEKVCAFKLALEGASDMSTSTSVDNAQENEGGGTSYVPLTRSSANVTRVYVGSNASSTSHVRNTSTNNARVQVGGSTSTAAPSRSTSTNNVRFHVGSNARAVTTNGIGDLIHTDPSIVCASTLQRFVPLFEVEIHASAFSSNCVYCAIIGFNPVTGKLIMKYGKTEDLHNRLRNHRKTYPFFHVLFVISFGAFSAKPAEDTITAFVHSRSLLVSVKGSTRREMFSCAPNETDDYVDTIIEKVKSDHPRHISRIFDKTNSGFVHETNVEIQREITRKAAIEAAMKTSIEATKSETAKNKMRAELLAYLAAHPENFADLLHLL